MARLRNRYPVYWKHEKHEDVFISGKHKKKLPPLKILNWMFRYDSESGKLYKIRESSGKLCSPEREITTVSSSGYLIVGITDSVGIQKMILVHHIIYYIVGSVEPLSVVDHRDGDSLNNRFDNLRLTTESCNQRNKKMQSNNTSGITGVFWNKSTGKWLAQASDNNGKVKYLGYFDNIETAAAVVQNFRNEMGTYSERHGVVA